jgi:hypothetical protein
MPSRPGLRLIAVRRGRGWSVAERVEDTPETGKTIGPNGGWRVLDWSDSVRQPRGIVDTPQTFLRRSGRKRSRRQQAVPLRPRVIPWRLVILLWIFDIVLIVAVLISLVSW